MPLRAFPGRTPDAEIALVQGVIDRVVRVDAFNTENDLWDPLTGFTSISTGLDHLVSKHLQARVVPFSVIKRVGCVLLSVVSCSLYHALSEFIDGSHGQQWSFSCGEVRGDSVQQPSPSLYHQV